MAQVTAQAQDPAKDLLVKTREVVNLKLELDFELDFELMADVATASGSDDFTSIPTSDATGSPMES